MKDQPTQSLSPLAAMKSRIMRNSLSGVERRKFGIISMAISRERIVSSTSVRRSRILSNIQSSSRLMVPGFRSSTVSGQSFGMGRVSFSPGVVSPFAA